MVNSQIINEIKCEIECQICYEKFIKLNDKQYCIFLEVNREILPDTFENDTCCLLYEDRFECLCCKSIICQGCYWSFENHTFKPDETYVEDYEYFSELDDDGFVEGCPGEDCPIICPFCRTKDYKIFYGNQIPYELLNEIKNKGF
jgi:hypothetical protein